MKLAFWGSSTFSIYILEELERAGILPSVVVTTPDKPVGRKLVVTPTAVKVWATSRQIPVLTPQKLDQSFILELRQHAPDVSVVASYGKIIPAEILDIPKYKTLNVHPSLLPRYRGATPIQSAILDDAKSTGVSVMVLDELMDHGPIVTAESVTFDEWPVYEEAEERLGRAGGTLLAKILVDWCDGKIKGVEQDHDQATYTKKITKEDGEIKIDAGTGEAGDRASARKNFLKIQAYHHWPTAFFYKDGKRVKITKASYKDGKLKIERIIVEGLPETDY